MVREAASKTSKDAGDGTTTATVLAEALFKAGLRQLAAGVDANALVRGMHKAANAVIDEIGSQARPVGDDVAAVATISANNDAAIGKIMADALAKVGKDGVVTVEEGKSLETWVDVVEGMQFDRGFSPQLRDGYRKDGGHSGQAFGLGSRGQNRFSSDLGATA